MAACDSLDHIFEKPLSENPTFLESLSPWKHIKSTNSIDSSSSSFTEIFGELDFKENHVIHNSIHESLPSSSSSSSLSSNIAFSPQVNSTCPHDHQDKTKSISKSSYYNNPSSEKKKYRDSDSFSSMSSESLSLCTEGLGFESFDDADDLLKNEVCNNEWQHEDRRKSLTRNNTCTDHNRRFEPKRSRTSRGELPPPISCIGRSGKPWVCFKSYREDGRFILKEIRIPTQEFLHACRENGRLKLQFIQSDDEIIDEDDDEEEDEDNIEEQNIQEESCVHENDSNERVG